METRYIINPSLVKTNPNSEEVLNTSNGSRHKLSGEALELLKAFSSGPKTLKSLVNDLGLDESDVEELSEFIDELAKEKIIISDDLTLEERIAPDADRVIFETPLRTFFSTPATDKSLTEGVDIGFVGIPFDLGATGFPGARFAPDRMRELSSDAFEYHADVISGKGLGWWAVDSRRRILEGQALSDFGNVILQVGENYDAYYQRITSAVSILLKSHIFPVIVGGDHSITYAILRAYSKFFDSVKVVHIDAHTDLGDLILGVANNHGNVFTRVMEGKLVDYLYQIGIRGFSGKRPKYENYSVLTQNMINANSVDAYLAQMEPGNYYLSIDIDVLDPIYAPGTGTPVSNGMDVKTLFYILEKLAANVNIVGMDLVEINSMRDSNDQTTELALSLIMHALSNIFR